MSHVTWQFEETPRYENAPTTTPFRVSTAKHFFPITAGRIGANPQFRNRDDELRGNLSPMGDIVEMFSPEGSLAVGGYLHTAIPLLHAAGFVMTIVQGDGVNEVQTITSSGSVTGGTYQLTIVPLVGMAGIVVSNIPWNATAAEVQRLWLRGRGRPVTAEDLEASDAVSDTFVPRAHELLRKHAREPETFVREMENLSRYSRPMKERLRAYLAEVGCLVEASPHEREEIVRLTLVADATAVEALGVDAAVGWARWLLDLLDLSQGSVDHAQ